MPVQHAESHAVPAVIHEQRLRLFEIAVDLAVIGNGDAFRIAAFGETGSQAFQRAVRRAPQEGAVGHAAAGMAHHPAPRCLGVHIQMGEVWFSLGHSAAPYRYEQRWGRHVCLVESDGCRATVIADGKSLGSYDCGV